MYVLHNCCVLWGGLNVPMGTTIIQQKNMLTKNMQRHYAEDGLSENWFIECKKNYSGGRQKGEPASV